VSRRLLGYRVKRADGTAASGIIAPEPVHDMTLSRDARDSCYLVPVFAVHKPKPARPAGNTGGPPPIFVAWTENLRPNTNPLDRINLIVERTERDAGLSLHHEVEESGPEVGKPALVRVIHPVTRYVPAPVVAAEGLFGWVDTTDGSWVHVGPMPRAEAESRPNLRNRERKLVRVLDDGAHEAAIAAAREEGRREGFAEAIRLVREEAENERRHGYHVLRTEFRRLADHLDNEGAGAAVAARKDP
jgi:hypothetical protein